MKDNGKCSRCAEKNKICKEEGGKGPTFCSTKLNPDSIAKATIEYDKSEIKSFAQNASIQEASCYIDRGDVPAYRFPVKPRVQEIIEFARKMEYHRLGVAFCNGLHQEATIFCKILEDHGFDVVSVICKVGGIDKSTIGLQDHDKVQLGGYEPMCNPIAQAEILNAAETDFNILLGLCVGHDSLFMKYSKAMVTVFAVKDRVLGHNPLAAIYNYNSYYERFKQDRIKELEVKNRI